MLCCGMLLTYLMAAGYGSVIAVAAKAWLQGGSSPSITCSELKDEIEKDERSRNKAAAASGELQRLVIIDVRDPTPVGGTVRGAIHVPCTVFDKAVKTVVDRDILAELGPDNGYSVLVVVYCMSSDVAAPAAAHMLAKEVASRGDASGKERVKIVVLKGGYKEWVAKHGAERGMFDEYEAMVKAFHCPIGIVPSHTTPIVLRVLEDFAFRSEDWVLKMLHRQYAARRRRHPAMIEGPAAGVLVGSGKTPQQQDEEMGVERHERYETRINARSLLAMLDE